VLSAPALISPERLERPGKETVEIFSVRLIIVILQGSQ
jgi:hypothetical protein